LNCFDLLIKKREIIMKRFYWIFCILMPLILIPGSASAENEKSMYRIKPADQLNVYVHENADLTMTVAVLPDGTISFPLVGNLYVQGLTTAGLQNVLREKLQEYLVNPVVVVTISSQTAYKVYVLGEVGSPGALPYDEKMRLTDYLALAGGMTPEANLKECYIYSSGVDKPRRAINLKEIFEEDKVTLDILLQPEDTIVLKRRSGFFITEWVEVAQIFSILVASATLYVLATRD